MAIIRLGGLSRRLGGRATALGVGIQRSRGAGGAPPQTLSVHASGRYLTRGGLPWLIVGDTSWSLAVQCTTGQIDSYLNDRQSKGCNALLFSAIEHEYSSQTPAYRNAAGHDPFTVMSPCNWVLNESYWTTVDHIVNGLNSRGMVALINPAYYGLSGDGWVTELNAASDATLQAYGVALANRYTQGNVMWSLGGDNAMSSGDRTKQWQIVVGMRTVRTTDLITGHTARAPTSPDGVNGEAHLAWGSGYAGFNLNNVYLRDDANDQAGPHAANAYGRSGPLPFFMIEAGYEPSSNTMTSVDVVPTIRCVLGGGLAGGFAGHDVLWHVGSFAPDDVGAASALSSHLAASWTEMGYLRTLLNSYAWHLLAPKTDASLVTTSLGSGSTLISAARASDGSFAMVHTPSQNFTVAMSQLTPSSVRGRWWNWADGTFSAASGSPYANSGTQAFTAPGDRILVLDAA